MTSKSAITTARRMTTRARNKAPLFAAAGLIEEITPEAVEAKRQRGQESVTNLYERLEAMHKTSIARYTEELRAVCDDTEFTALMEKAAWWRENHGLGYEASTLGDEARKRDTPSRREHQAFWAPINTAVEEARRQRETAAKQQLALF